MGLFSRLVIMTLLMLGPVLLPGCSGMEVSDSLPPSPEAVGELVIHFIDAGQGDSTFIQTDSGKNILVDTGSPASAPGVVRYLKNLGVRRIDHLILTHPHDDHIGGIFSLLAEISADRFYDNGFSNFSSTMYGDYVSLVRKDLSRYAILQAGKTLRAGNAKIEVINPLLPPTGDMNNDSVVLRIIFGDIKVLISGDMGETGERRLLNIGADIRSHVIRTGHHGENDVCSYDYLRSVGPEAAVISAGSINKFARPHPSLLERLDHLGIKVYRTDRDSHVVLRTDGTSYSIHTEQ